MLPEEVELENVKRYERLLIEKFKKLSVSLERNIAIIKDNLTIYEVDNSLLDRIGSVFYEACKYEDMKEVELQIKALADTFWDRMMS